MTHNWDTDNFCQIYKITWSRYTKTVGSPLLKTFIFNGKLNHIINSCNKSLPLPFHLFYYPIHLSQPIITKPDRANIEKEITAHHIFTTTIIFSQTELNARFKMDPEVEF